VSPKEPSTLAFRFVSERGTGRVSWEGPTDWTAEALFAASMEGDKTRAARKEAREFLQKALDLGPLPTNEVIDAGKAHGIAPRTLERARRDLGVMSERRGGRKGTWYLKLLESPDDRGQEPRGDGGATPEAKHRHPQVGGLSDSSRPDEKPPDRPPFG